MTPGDAAFRNASNIAGSGTSTVARSGAEPSPQPASARIELSARRKALRRHVIQQGLQTPARVRLPEPPEQLGQVDARLQAVVAARAAAGDAKLATFDLGTQPLGSNGETPTGCDWHPNTADHARMAEILKTQLKAKLGW